MNTEAIVLAGGMGTRLRSVISNIPKPMALVADRPFIAYIFDQLIEAGITHVKLSVGYKFEVIRDYFGHRYKQLHLEYVIEIEALGTGGGIRLAMEQCTSDSVLVCNGDTFFDVNLGHFIAQHQSNNNGMTIALKQLEHVNRYGMVELNETKIYGFTEKSNDLKSGFINGGIYAINRSQFLDRTIAGNFSMEVDFMEKMVNVIRMEGHLSDGYFIDIGIPEDYQKANEYFGK
ncbi:MAG: D-glycero-alpha-D-manno-heptose 1-phosphate guanylyltransferase [Bacteroidia bacterium]|jgi:D-glycero-alpha-D-manno-heptose 1-phosphate guanylyltransferase